MAAVYLVGLVIVCLTPDSFVITASKAARRTAPFASFSTLDAALNVVLFVPLGLLVLLMVGRKRWITVVIVGIIGSCWLQLAEMVWLPTTGASTGSFLEHIGGAAIGVGLGLVALRLRAGRVTAVKAAPVHH